MTSQTNMSLSSHSASVPSSSIRNFIQICTWNVRSIQDTAKRQLVSDYLKKSKTDLAVITETWLNSHATWDENYEVVLSPSCHNQGVAILFNKEAFTSLLPLYQSFHSPNLLIYRATVKPDQTKQVIIIGMYR